MSKRDELVNKAISNLFNILENGVNTKKRCELLSEFKFEHKQKLKNILKNKSCLLNIEINSDNDLFKAKDHFNSSCLSMIFRSVYNPKKRCDKNLKKCINEHLGEKYCFNNYYKDRNKYVKHENTFCEVRTNGTDENQ